MSPLSLLFLPFALVTDSYSFARAILGSLVAFGRSVYHGSIVTSLRTRDPGDPAIVMDLRCVSWMLRTSFDKAFHLSALKYLAGIPELACFDPSLIIGCFDVFISCINVIDNTLVMVQGLEVL